MLFRSVLVERLSGRSLLDYLKEKVLNHIGGFEGAQILKTPDGTPWGDSALICTPRDLLRFARFVMNDGIWDGKRLLSEAYVRAATSRQADNNLEGNTAYNRYGYGYQIWRHACGFSFNGLGGQFAICVPEKDFIFVCTADMQLSSDKMCIRDSVYTVSVVFFSIALSILIGVFLNKNKRIYAFVQTIVFTPYILSMVAVAVLFCWLFDVNSGFFNFILTSLGFEPLMWLRSESTSLMSIIIVSVWKDLGYSSLMVIAGLQSIPKSVYAVSYTHL